MHKENGCAKGFKGKEIIRHCALDTESFCCRFVVPLLAVVVIKLGKPCIVFFF